MRAKFRLDSIKRTISSVSVPDPENPGKYKSERKEMHSLELFPVYGNGDPNHENTKFWQASPSGKIELGVVNLDAVKDLELGGEYYVDFTPAPKA